jgi:signal transduction histidine kinase
VTERGGRIELINDRAAELLSATQASLIGRNAAKHLPAFDTILNRGEGEDTRNVDMTLEDGVTLEVNVRRLSLADGKETAEAQFDVYTLRDVTAKRRAEEAERRAHEERLMAERARSNFIANMSHELRTPLNAVIGFSEIMSSEALGPMGVPAYVEYANEVTKSGRHLLGLVNNVLELSRIDGDDDVPDSEEFNFESCAQSCVELTRMTRDFKGQEIEVHPTAGNFYVRSVPRLVKHLLINLLSNAVKFSAADGKVSITSWAEGEDFAFEVADNGVGIDPAVLPNLTTMFYRTNTGLTREHDGLGVGLFLVKRALNRVGGTLQFDSAPGKGTRVRVRLPNAAAPGRAPAEADADAA